MQESRKLDPFAIMYRAFPASPELILLTRQNADTFWNAQQALLEDMRDVAEGWFERRRTGTHEALACARGMCDAVTPFEALREYQKWAIGSFERLMQDAFAWQEHMAEAARLGVQPLAKAADATRAAAASDSGQRPHSRRAA